MMTCRDFGVELIQSQMLLGVLGKQGQPCKGISVSPEFACNVHGNTCTTLSGVEVVKVQGARGLPTL